MYASLDLYNYYEFIEKILAKVFKIFIKQQVFVVELRHIFGMIIDDDGKQLTVKQELDIFDRVLANVQRDYPLFTCKIIICGLKIIGKDHIDKQIERIFEALALNSKLIVGFDMVNEEDYSAPLRTFLKEVIEADHRGGEGKFPVIFHGK